MAKATAHKKLTLAEMREVVLRELDHIPHRRMETRNMRKRCGTKVQYAYSAMPSGANHSRLTSITYPNGRVITYNYATGLASAISRLFSISDNGTTLEGYDYLGLGTVVRRTHPQSGIDL